MKDVNDPTWQSEAETAWYRKIEDDLGQRCAKPQCGGTRGMLVHKVSLLVSDPWLEGVEDVHEFVPETKEGCDDI